MANHVHGLFVSEATALAAMADLESAGFTHDKVALIANQVPSPTDLNHRKVADALVDAAPDEELPGVGTAAGVGAATGATVGLLGSVGALGLLAVPVVGPIVATGWLASMLIGAAAGTAVGGLVGLLGEVGVTGPDADFYNDAIHQGMALVTVACDDDDIGTARAILARHGAVTPGGGAGSTVPVRSAMDDARLAAV